MKVDFRLKLKEIEKIGEYKNTKTGEVCEMRRAIQVRTIISKGKVIERPMYFFLVNRKRMIITPTAFKMEWRKYDPNRKPTTIIRKRS